MGDIKAMGTISTSNVNNPNSECITLTYTIQGLKNMKAIGILTGELDGLIGGEESHVDVEIKNLGEEYISYKMKYKVKTCDSEERAHDIKADLDKFLKKKGGQTTLDVAPKEDDDGE